MSKQAVIDRVDFDFNMSTGRAKSYILGRDGCIGIDHQIKDFKPDKITVYFEKHMIDIYNINKIFYIFKEN